MDKVTLKDKSECQKSSLSASWCRELRSSQTRDTFTGTQEQQPFSFVAPTPFFHLEPPPAVRESAAGKQHLPHHGCLGIGRWGRDGRGLEVNYRQQRGHRAYYFGAGTCNGPMGMTFTTRARPHPSITIHTHNPPRTPSLTFILKEATVGLSGLIMKRPLAFGRGRMMNWIHGCSLLVSGGLQVALDN